jgi:mitotic spindle assembly checkpoint protein MAD2
MAEKAADKEKSKVHKLSLKGSAKLVAEFVGFSPMATLPLEID